MLLIPHFGGIDLVGTVPAAHTLSVLPGTDLGPALRFTSGSPLLEAEKRAAFCSTEWKVRRDSRTRWRA